MGSDEYKILFISAACLSGAMLLLSVYLFVKFNIPRVIQDMLGITARNAINDIRNQNAESGDKAYKPSYINMERGKITDKISDSGRVDKSTSSPLGTSVGTEVLNTEIFSDDTTVLAFPEETTLLSDTQANKPIFAQLDTNPFYNGNEQTIWNGTPFIPPQVNSPNSFVVEEDITFIHTNETIYNQT